MKIWQTGQFRRHRSTESVSPGQLLFPVLTVAGFVILLLMARHSSESPELFGRWTLRYASLLALQTLVTLSFAALSVPALRIRLFTQHPWEKSAKLAHALVAAGLALLFLSWLVMRKLVLPGNDPVLVLFAGLVLITIVILVTFIFWRRGITSLVVSPAPQSILIPLIVGQLLLTAVFLGQVPAIDVHDEARVIGNSLRQFTHPDRFILLQPDRNSSTWFYFQGYWILSGAWMNQFGAGFFQARLFNLLIAWLGVPFLYLIARRWAGQQAALIASCCGIMLPLHFVTSRSDVWVATATTIALHFLILSRHSQTTRTKLHGFLCGLFSVSAVDGHAYGAAFSLMFGLLYLAPLFRLLRGNASQRERGSVTGFAAGCFAWVVFWLIYHLLLPGVSISTLPDVIQATLRVETDLGRSTHGTGLNADNVLKFFQLFLYFNPYALALSVAGAALALKERTAADRDSLFVGLGAALAIFLTLAHFAKSYPLFWLPFVCLWSGTGLSRTFAPAGPDSEDRGKMSPGGLFVLLAFIMLSTIHLSETANLRKPDFERAKLLAQIGQEADKLLPNRDIAVAGTAEIYVGMPWRLNYGGSCSFTRDDPQYWPLDQPQAVIATPGWDKGCHELAGWLTEHNFQPARCFTGHDLGEGVTILYLSPELMPSEEANNCSSEHLAWLEVT